MVSAGGTGAISAAIERVDRHERNVAQLLLRRRHHLYR